MQEFGIFFSNMLISKYIIIFLIADVFYMSEKLLKRANDLLNYLEDIKPGNKVVYNIDLFLQMMPNGILK